MRKKETIKSAPASAPKHTPGPWAFTEGDVERRAMSEVFKAKDKTYGIALVNCEWSNPSARAEDIANARLIAAAPDLLAACKSIMELLLNGSPTVPSAPIKAGVLDAIAKAEGTS